MASIAVYCPLMSERQTILVVEDDEDLRRLFRTSLALAGYDVIEAGDGLDDVVPCKGQGRAEQTSQILIVFDDQDRLPLRH